MADHSWWGGMKTPFSIATKLRYKGGHYSFSWIASLYPWYVPYNAVLSKEAPNSIFFSVWYDSNWDWTPVSQTIGEYSTHYGNELFYIYIYVYVCVCVCVCVSKTMQPIRWLYAYITLLYTHTYIYIYIYCRAHIWLSKSRTTSMNIHSATMWGYRMEPRRPARGDER